MKLVLITQDYPYGYGEPFLETEIKYASKYFAEIIIISLSRVQSPCRKVPENVHYFKISREYKVLSCLLYAITKFFSKEALNELKNIKKLRHKPNFYKIIKSWIITWMIKKRLDIAIRLLKISYSDTVFYSYWLASSAYFIAKLPKNINYKISRAHRFEVIDNENYIPFRTQTDEGLNEISFISEYTQKEYNIIIKNIKNSKISAHQSINKLGVTEQEINDILFKREKNEVFRLVSCSTINSLKRIDIIIDALSEIKNYGKIEWIHLGWGPLGEKISEYCKFKLSNKKNISYKFAGLKTNEKILNFYKNNYIDLFINTSDNEGIPVSIMEAMSFGIPCLARDVGGNSEIVKNSVSGYLIPVDASIKEIAAIIDNIMDKKNITLVERTKVIEYFNLNYNAKMNYEKFYNRITNIQQRKYS